MPISDNRALRKRMHFVTELLETASKVLVRFAVVLLVFAILMGIGAWMAVRSTQKHLPAMAAVPQPLKTSDMTGEQLAQLVEAYDPDFYTHRGVSSHAPGLTTITQRLVEQFYYDDYNGVFEFLPASLQAWALNRAMPKDDQLRLFINSFKFGVSREQEVRGFQDAAKMFYDKKWRELNRDEYLQIIAMLEDPEKYHIQSEPNANIERSSRLKKLLDGGCKRLGIFDTELKGCK